MSLLFSSILWSAVVPLKQKLAFGLVFSIFFQELFRFGIYALLSKADAYLKKLTENEETKIFANKHILSYGKQKLIYLEPIVKIEGSLDCGLILKLHEQFLYLSPTDHTIMRLHFKFFAIILRDFYRNSDGNR